MGPGDEPSHPKGAVKTSEEVAWNLLCIRYIYIYTHVCMYICISAPPLQNPGFEPDCFFFLGGGGVP